MTPTTSDAVFHEVLIVERDPRTTRVLLEAFARHGIRGTVVGEVAKADAYLDARRFDAVFVNLQTVSGNGNGSLDLRLLRKIRADRPETPILVTSNMDCGHWAVEALRAGATEFYAKPLKPETVEHVLAALLPSHAVTTLATLPAPRGRVRKIVGSSQELLQTVQRAVVVAPTSAPVLIHGQSGTGKELIAQLIHCRSRRAAGPFIKVNCAALNESLLESELFGHEKGAFTGACRRFHGRFEQAHGGTLLLDEITETPPSFQAKLLRVLEEMNFQRVGGSEEIAVNVRIISTTNADILREVHDGRFRADLYYRLAGIRLVVPPLHKRPRDIPTLIWFFINEFTKEIQRPITAIDSESLDVLRNYTWPGNVRQLRNAVRTAMIFGSGQVLSLADAPWLLEELQSDASPQPVADLAGISLRDIERQAILATLDASQGNQTQAAKVLGISGRTLREKIKRYRQQATQPSRMAANS